MGKLLEQKQKNLNLQIDVEEIIGHINWNQQEKT